MTRYGEEYKLNTEEMENIATYMNERSEKTLTSRWLHVNRKIF